jgi:crotonobetainyl-CoA:carnitine CoA-transferase CaiB-like acyl-CoA transferase
MSGPLKGITVLDLTQMLAGPLGTMILGDLGADIIKIEPPGGDSLRTTGDTFVGGSRESEGYLSINRNKKSVVLDLKRTADQQIIRQLALQADVIIENYRPGAIDRMGLRYEDLAKKNPGLIFCSVNGFGATGPNASRPALDQVIQALSGLMQLTGTEESGPLRTGFPYADIISPLFATIGILSALYARDRSGRGQRVDVSMLHATIFGMVPRDGYFFATGQSPKRFGNKHYQVVPCGTYRTSDDRLLLLIAHQPKFWDALVKASRDPAFEDPRFATNKQRLGHRAEIDERLTKLISSATLAEWTKRLDDASALYAPVRTWPEVFSDPSVKDDVLVKFDHPTAGEITSINNPIKFSETKIEMRYRPPLLGEHTEEVLQRLKSSTKT